MQKAKMGWEDMAKNGLPRGEISSNEMEHVPKKLKEIESFRSGKSYEDRMVERRKRMEEKIEQKGVGTRKSRFRFEKEEEDERVEVREEGMSKTTRKKEKKIQPQVLHTSVEMETVGDGSEKKNKKKGFLQYRKEKIQNAKKKRLSSNDVSSDLETGSERIRFGETAEKPPDITLRRKGMPGTEIGKKNQKRLTALFRKQFKDAQAKATGNVTSKEERRKKKRSTKPLVEEKMRLEIIQAYRKKRGRSEFDLANDARG